MVGMATSPADIAAPSSRPTQFSLRSVLLLTAAVAGSCALISWLGVGWLPLLLGMTLFLANYLGMFGVLQGRRVAQAALYLAAAAWGVSMFLPIAEVSGWWVATEFFKRWLDGPQNHQHLWPPAAHDLAGLLTRANWVFGVGLTILVNLAMPLCALLAHRMASGKACWLRTILAWAMPAVWLWFVVMYLFMQMYSPEPQRISFMGPGYLVWCGAATMTAVVLPIMRWQLIGASLVSLWLAVGAWIWIEAVFSQWN